MSLIRDSILTLLKSRKDDLKETPIRFKQQRSIRLTEVKMLNLILEVINKCEYHILVQDDSCHWYIIPDKYEDDWDEWLKSDEIELGNVPDYAEVISGNLRSVKILEYRIK